MQAQEIALTFMIAIVCVAIFANSIPFTEPQFYSQVTDLNYSSVLNGDNNNQILIIKDNKISVADANDLNIALPDLSAYVDWVDGNNTYVIKSDLNDLIPKIGDVNCINGDKVLGYVEGFSC